MGRRKIQINYDILNALLQFKVTKGFCAEYLGVSEDTIDRRLKTDHKMTFSEYHGKRIQRTAYKLQQKAIEMALSGNATMMIFSLKNIAGWVDKVETKNTNENETKIQIDISDTEL